MDPTTFPHLYSCVQEFGKVPGYLRERYKPGKEKEEEKEDKKKKPPLRYVTEDEREEMLQVCSNCIQLLLLEIEIFNSKFKTFHKQCFTRLYGNCIIFNLVFNIFKASK